MDISQSEVLYVKGMKPSESEEDYIEDDVWDDTKLKEAYDKAYRIANAEVAKRVAMSTNSHGKKDYPKPKKEKTLKNQWTTVNHTSKTEWKVGMPCRAIYDGDGLEYEAIITRLVAKKECVVRFLGYDNSQVVSMAFLKPSHGKEAQGQQIEDCLNDNEDGDLTETAMDGNEDGEIDLGSDRAAGPENSYSLPHKKRKSSHKKKSNQGHSSAFEVPEFMLGSMSMPMPNPSFMRNMNLGMPLMPPPPLAPPMNVDSEEQAVSSMLLSWYMSGYYTGLYQGIRRAKENRRNRNDSQ